MLEGLIIQNMFDFFSHYQFDINHHVLLTGTPVQNNLAELYALLSFVAPNIFKGKYLEKFVEKYNDVETGSDGRWYCVPWLAV